MRTFKDLQDSVLDWQADGEDTSLMRTLAKDALNQAHREFLMEQMYDFMLFPQIQTITLEVGRKLYSLNPLFGQMLWAYNPDIDEYLEEIPSTGTFEIEENPYDAPQGTVQRYLLTSLQPVKRQPSVASVVTVTPTGGTELAANGIILKGIDSSDEYAEETLSSTTTWSSLVSATSFKTLTAVVKTGTTWTRTITLTDSAANELLVLGTGDFVKQYRQFELLKSPSSTTTIAYKFYMKPKQLVEDNDYPQLPEEFDQILIYRALQALGGYSRPTAQEQEYWKTRLDKLERDCKATYTQARSLNGRASYIHYEPRI